MPATIYKIIDAFLAAFTTFFTKLTGDFFKCFGINIGAVFPTMEDKNRKLTAVLNSFNKGKSFFDLVFPHARSFERMFVIMAVCFCIMMILINLMKSMIGPFTEGEHPIAVASRGMVSLFASVFSYHIFLTIEYVMNFFYIRFSEITVMKPKKLEDAEKLLFDKSVITKILGVESDSGAEMKLMVAIVALAAVILILFNFLKLLLSMIEQYVTLGVMFYTCPLAFGTLASASTRDIFKAWVRMVYPQCLLLISNLFFVNVFIYAINNIGKVFYAQVEITETTKGLIYGNTPKEVTHIGSGDVRLTIVSYIVVLCMLVAWLIVAQKFGDYLKALGLNTVSTGRGLAGAVMATAGTTAFVTPKLLKKTVGLAGTAAGAAVGGGKKVYGHFNPKEAAKPSDKPSDKPVEFGGDEGTSKNANKDTSEGTGDGNNLNKDAEKEAKKKSASRRKNQKGKTESGNADKKDAAEQQNINQPEGQSSKDVVGASEKVPENGLPGTGDGSVGGTDDTETPNPVDAPEGSLLETGSGKDNETDATETSSNNKVVGAPGDSLTETENGNDGKIVAEKTQKVVGATGGSPAETPANNANATGGETQNKNNINPVATKTPSDNAGVTENNLKKSGVGAGHEKGTDFGVKPQKTETNKGKPPNKEIPVSKIRPTGDK